MTIFDWFGWIQWMRPRGWWNSCSTSTGIVQITLSSVSLCLSLSEVDHRCSLWNLAPRHSCDIFYASKVCLYVIETYCHSSFAFWTYFVFLLVVFHKFLEPSRHFKFWKWNIMFVMVFSLPHSYILWDFCIWNMLNCCNLRTLCYKSVRNCARCKCKYKSLCEHFITVSCMATSKCFCRRSIDTCDAAVSVPCLYHTGQSMSGTLPLALLWRVSTLRMFLCQWLMPHPLPLCLEIRVRK